MTENAYNLLRLEQRLESCQRVHQEELDEIRRAIVELRNQILFNLPAPETDLNGKQKYISPTDEYSLAGCEGNQDDSIEHKARQNQKSS